MKPDISYDNRTYAYIHREKYVHMYIYMYAHTHLYIYIPWGIYIYICIHTFTHITLQLQATFLAHALVLAVPLAHFIHGRHESLLQRRRKAQGLQKPRSSGAGFGAPWLACCHDPNGLRSRALSYMSQNRRSYTKSCFNTTPCSEFPKYA